jgi:tellurite resistance protein
MVLAAALATVACGAGRTLVLVFLVATVALAGWQSGQWIAGDGHKDSAHSGYFLPGVAGGLVGAYATTQVHLRAIGEASFGIGIACWVLLASVILDRLMFVHTLPPALVPTLAIELAPPALAGSAYFALTGGSADPVAYAIGGFTVVMALAQLRLVPLYARLPFSLGFWSFAFAYASAAAYALTWIRVERPPGAAGYAVAVLTLITILVAAIMARSVIAAARGQVPSAPGPPRRPLA